MGEGTNKREARSEVNNAMVSATRIVVVVVNDVYEVDTNSISIKKGGRIGIGTKTWRRGRG
jgi:hypothetical protein